MLMLNLQSRSQPLAFVRVLLSILLALSFLLAAFPSQAQAATTTCVAYYTVQKGDTTTKIAKTFGLRWRQIAVANDMEYPYVLKAGMRLCIPPKDFSTEPTVPAAAVLKAQAVNNRLTVTVSNTSARRAFYVRVRDASSIVGGWTKLGSIKVPKNTTVVRSYSLPANVSKATHLQVCLKEATTDQLVCTIVLRTYR
jgi:LysM repeat protein